MSDFNMSALGSLKTLTYLYNSMYRFSCQQERHQMNLMQYSFFPSSLHSFGYMALVPSIVITICPLVKERVNEHNSFVFACRILAGNSKAVM